ncbi:MAG TPA: PqqD family protein [Dehalococcoidia bacterium]|nr:PqqD family protein [Dehalococcoidia bacterium]
MLALKPGVVLVLEPNIVLRSIPDQDWFFAFNVVTGDEFRLNSTSFWILEALGNGAEWIELKGSFLEAFEVVPEQGERDLRELVNDLFEEKLIGRRSNGEEKNEI